MPAAVTSTWAPGPRQPVLEDRTVHVWRADLTTVSDDLGELLCSDERARAARFMSERDAQLWTRSHGLLRALLGRYTQREPSSLRFAIGEHGKPTLTDNSLELAFNMSHSGALALYAFSDAGAVGVDVEVARRPIDEVAIAARTLGAAEAERLRALEPPARQREFLGAWARHESELKCLGIGLGGSAAPSKRQALWVLELAIGADAAAAVACERIPSELCRWQWPSA